ncbi:hypothetical protein V6N11_061948 [Hibiscus sabdariffa]|uniref:Uncharacterized protein n=1 Tax=Hibiscus sabdariffa TaxID=183260 RepID=A0ABR2PRW3_9ROSI
MNLLIDPFPDTVLPQFVHGDSYIAQDDPVPQRSVATEAIEDGIIPEEVQNHEFATEEIQNHEFATEEVQNHGVEDTGSVHADVHEASNGAANVHADVVPVIRRSSRVTVVVVEGGSARNGGGSTSSPVLHLSEVYAATGGCLLVQNSRVEMCDAMKAELAMSRARETN